MLAESTLKAGRCSPQWPPDTTAAQIGILVSCNSYRNPDLLADMARTVDHISGGRAYLGIGSGWMQMDYDEYGYEFGTAGSRLAALEEALPRIRDRLSQLNPGPVGDLPIMIGGQGEKVTMRIIAEHADSWNCMADPTRFGHLNGILNDWCERVGRNPENIERTVLTGNPEELPGLVEVGADHVIIMSMAPHDLATLGARHRAARLNSRQSQAVEAYPISIMRCLRPVTTPVWKCSTSTTS